MIGTHHDRSRRITATGAAIAVAIGAVSAVAASSTTAISASPVTVPVRRVVEVVAAGSVVVVTDRAADFQGYDVTAYRPDGSVAWQLQDSLPVIDTSADGTHVLGRNELGEVHVLRAADGEVRWATEDNRRGSGSRFVGDDVYIAGAEAHALHDAATGEQHWAIAPVIVGAQHADSLYVEYWDAGGTHLFARVHAATGIELWSTETSNREARVHVGAGFVLRDEDAGRTAFDRDTGERLWTERSTPRNVWEFSDGRIVFEMRPDDGDPEWPLFDVDGAAGELRLAGYTSFETASIDGTTYALGSDGTLWSSGADPIADHGSPRTAFGHGGVYVVRPDRLEWYELGASEPGWSAALPDDIDVSRALGIVAFDGGVALWDDTGRDLTTLVLFAR